MNRDVQREARKTGFRAWGLQDHGFTLGELVMAATIMLFASTAMITLMTTFQRQAQVAVQKANLTNALASYVEYARSAPMTQTLPATTTAVGPYSMQMTPTVTWVAASDSYGSWTYKRVRIDGRSWVTARPGLSVLTGVVESNITTAR